MKSFVRKVQCFFWVLFLFFTTSQILAQGDNINVNESSRSIKEIIITGLQWTNPEIIRTKLDLAPGDEISPEQIPELTQIIENYGRFRNIVLTITNVEDGLAILEVHCEDYFPMFGYPWGSYNSYSGFSGSIDFSHNNISKNLDTLSLGVSLGWNPAIPSPDSLTSYGLYCGYNNSNIPSWPGISLSLYASTSMYSTLRFASEEGSTSSIDYYAQQRSISAVLSASWRWLAHTIISASLNGNYSWGRTVVANPNFFYL